MIKQYSYRNAHTIVSEISLLELGPAKLTLSVDEVDHFRFTVTGTNTNTGVRQQFSFAMISKLTPSQRGALDLPYIYRLIDETIQIVLAGYGYFITGNASRGAQFERAFERFILSPGSVAATLPDGTRVTFEGRGSVFEATVSSVESDDFKNRTEGRPYIVISEKKVYPYIAEDIPKWGQNEVTVTKAADLYTPRVEQAVHDHFKCSKALPGDRTFPAILLAQESGGVGRMVGRIEAPQQEIIVKAPVLVRRSERPVPKIEREAIPTHRLDEEDMVLWNKGVQENDLAMRAPRPLRTPWKTHRAVG